MTQIWKYIYFFVTLHAEVKQYSPKTYQEDYGSIHQTRDAEPERHRRTASVLSIEDQSQHQLQGVCETHQSERFGC